MRCIEAPRVGYTVVWGVSNNTRSYWTPTGSEALGWHPIQNAEDYAAEILAKENPISEIGRRYQGGSFAAIDFTPPDRRPGGL